MAVRVLPFFASLVHVLVRMRVVAVLVIVRVLDVIVVVRRVRMCVDRVAVLVVVLVVVLVLVGGFGGLIGHGIPHVWVGLVMLPRTQGQINGC